MCTQKRRGLTGTHQQLPGAHLSSRAPAAASRLPLTCLLQVHGGGCWHRCGSCPLAGGRQRLLCGRCWGRVPVLLLPLSRRVPQGLCPPEETGGRAEMQRPCTLWWTQCWQLACPQGGQEERVGRRSQRTAGPRETLPARDFGVGKLLRLTYCSAFSSPCKQFLPSAWS